MRPLRCRRRRCCAACPPSAVECTLALPLHRSTLQAMADIEQELTAYAERRAGGRTARAARLVADAAHAYRAAVQAMQRHGASSNKFWKALEVRGWRKHQRGHGEL